MLDEGEVVMFEAVTFRSGDQTLVGHLFPAAFGSGPAPAVVIVGPMTFVEEQAPLQYARRLASSGYTSLIFDPRYRGESGGEPRCLEDPVAKVADLRAAVAFLAERQDGVTAATARISGSSAAAWIAVLPPMHSPSTANRPASTTFHGDEELLTQTIAGIGTWLGWNLSLLTAEWWLERGFRPPRPRGASAARANTVVS
jgi:dienelactone hydrolase